MAKEYKVIVSKLNEVVDSFIVKPDDTIIINDKQYQFDDVSSIIITDADNGGWNADDILQTFGSKKPLRRRGKS